MKIRKTFYYNYKINIHQSTQIKQYQPQCAKHRPTPVWLHICERLTNEQLSKLIFLCEFQQHSSPTTIARHCTGGTRKMHNAPFDAKPETFPGIFITVHYSNFTRLEHFCMANDPTIRHINKPFRAPPINNGLLMGSRAYRKFIKVLRPPIYHRFDSGMRVATY